MRQVDIAIIGGGMIGLALAVALKDLECQVLVIERDDLDEAFFAVPDHRVSAINRASEQIFTNLGAWSKIQTHVCAPYTSMQVWEKDSFANIQMTATDIAQDNLGHIIENRQIQRALFETAQQQENLEIITGQKCERLNIGDHGAFIHLDNGDMIATKLIVAADGARSWVRETLAIPTTFWDYGQEAIVANVMTEQAHQSIARQIFTPNGPLAFLPLSQANTCSIVWSTDASTANQLVDLPKEAFEKQLSTTFDTKLGLCTLTTEVKKFPLTMRYARDFVRERVVLIGDAAHSIHPLAGQGVNLGLLDMADLVDTLTPLIANNQDIGTGYLLRPFERKRKAQAVQMIAAMQGFHELFTGTHPLKKLIRGVGMTLTDRLPLLKDKFMQKALGLDMDLPSLAKMPER